MTPKPREPDPLATLRDPGATLAGVDRELIRRGGLAEFVRLAWPVLEPGHPLLWGWHLDALCEHVQAVLDGKLTRLLVSVPPGTMKSLVAAVFAPAYQWGPAGRPNRRMLFTSYSQTSATRDSVRCRRLIESPWYLARWGDKFRLTTDQNTKTRYENNQTGFRASGSVGSGVTGERVGLVVCDDLLNREHAESDAHRKEASSFFWETLPSRVNDLDRDSFLVIAQRLHQADTIGEILSREPERWEKLVLPLEFEPASRCTTRLGFRDPRTEAGEVLHPDRFSKAAVAGLRQSLGSYAFAGQYQQRPAPREGGLIKTSWLSSRYSTRGEKPRLIVQSWDCASKPKERNDPSACLTAAAFQDGHIELWHALAERLEFPDLLRRTKDHAAHWKPNFVLVEDKDAGQQLVQTLRKDKDFRFKVEAVDPEGLDKYTRMAAEAPLMERGQLWLPDPLMAPGVEWLGPLLDEWLVFPAGAHDDQVDALSQLLKWLRRRPAGSGAWKIGVEDTERESPNRL